MPSVSNNCYAWIHSLTVIAFNSNMSLASEALLLTNYMVLPSCDCSWQSETGCVGTGDNAARNQLSEITNLYS